METQAGARTALVDPFGRDVEAWLDDSQVREVPYVSDLVVPRGDESDAGPEVATAPATEVTTAPVPDDASAPISDDAPAPEAEVASASPVDEAPQHDAPQQVDAFRRDRGRHRSACAPAFPEPPERLALRIGELAVLVDSSSGRPTIERIELLEAELLVRESDLARFRAWEASLPSDADPEVAAARAFARALFADILAGAAASEAAARHVGTRTSAISTDVERPAPFDAIIGNREAEDGESVNVFSAIVEAVRLERPSAPVPAHTRPTPLVLPATGPNAIHRLAVQDAIRTHALSESRPVEESTASVPDPAAVREAAARSAATVRPGNWWSRLWARLTRPMRRA
ncbi:hypothetical protein [Curtobacterium ammoniigenes]|uniref:hypothetical protein n=1 Tax=Curtobacterium ammoniigenes TaxID=395387 RepID=UPI0008378314|nr:hypothetical protein [Curtobacterium ammoniigenes]